MTDDVGRAAHLAEGFRRMVAQAAWSSWRRLPAHTRVWLDVEDMIEDGMWYLVRKAIPRWNAKRGAMSTFLHTCLEHFYDQHYYSTLVEPVKRNERHLLSFDQIADRRPSLSRERALELEMTKRHDYKSAERMVQECFVVPLMMQVYRQASAGLQEEIKHWFLLGTERLQVRNQKFVLARNEFRGLAKDTGLQIADCRHLLESPDCLDKLSRELSWGVMIG